MSSSCPSNKAFQKLGQLLSSGLRGRKVPMHVDLLEETFLDLSKEKKRPKQMICSADVKYQP